MSQAPYLLNEDGSASMATTTAASIPCSSGVMWRLPNYGARLDVTWRL